MKNTKKVEIRYKLVKHVDTISEYTCPACHTTFIGANVEWNTLMFKCDCGTALYIVNRKQVDKLTGDK